MIFNWSEILRLSYSLATTTGSTKSILALPNPLKGGDKCPVAVYELFGWVIALNCL
jgi:hypothetical protein